MAAEDLIFEGIFPAGIVYADRTRQEGGDYKKLAFLAYSSLALSFEKDCPKTLRAEITRRAQEIQSRRGQQFQISTCGQTVLLGDSHKA